MIPSFILTRARDILYYKMFIRDVKEVKEIELIEDETKKWFKTGVGVCIKYIYLPLEEEPNLLRVAQTLVGAIQELPNWLPKDILEEGKIDIIISQLYYSILDKNMRRVYRQEAPPGFFKK